MKKHIRLSGFLCAVMILAGVLNPVPVNAGTVEDVQEQSVTCYEDRCRFEKFELHAEEADEIELYDYGSRMSSPEDEYWISLSNDYYYNQLTDAEQEIWDGLEASCLEVVNGTQTVQVTGKIGNTKGIDGEKLLDTAYLFLYSNPQYYFLNGTIGYTIDYSAVWFELYDEFQDGEARRLATEAFRNKLGEWLLLVNEGKYDEDKEKIAYDLLANNTVYDLDSEFYQSAYSLVCNGRADYTGYTAVMQILMNAVGVDTITVASNYHAWNLIKLHDEWYAVDVTWGDKNDNKADGDFYGISYVYYNKSDKSIQDADGFHEAQQWWSAYTPELKYDSTSSTVTQYYTSYFMDDNYVYFTVNDNVGLDSRYAKVVDVLNPSADDIPATVWHDGKEYIVKEREEDELTITLDKYTAEIEAGKMVKIIASVNKGEVDLEWSSSDDKIAVVDNNGVVTGVANGVADITARYGETKAVCRITVTGGTTKPEEPTEPESTDKIQEFVSRLYILVLGRTYDEEGLISWTNSLKSHDSNGVDAGYGFVFSKECRERNLSNEEFVEILYNTFMNRPSDEGGKTAWVSQLNAGVEREKIFEGFVYSQEFALICSDYGINTGNVQDVAPLWAALQNYRNRNADVTKFVARCYTEAMGREYEPDGLEAWCKVIIEKSNTPKQVAQNFIFSEEFILKNLSDEEYVQILYRTFMGREADEGGLAAWVNVLESGREDRAKVLGGFSDSVEFAEILASFGLN